MLKTIRSRLFFCYSALLLAAAFLLSIQFYLAQKRTLENQAKLTLQTTAQSISQSIDREIQEMQELLQKIIFSEPLRQLEDPFLYSTSPDSLQRQREINQLIYSILGPQFPVDQLNIIQADGNFFSVGSSYNYIQNMSDRIQKITWVKQALENEYTALLLPPHVDDWGFSQDIAFSLCKAYSGRFGSQADRVIELQKDYRVLEEIARTALRSAPEGSAALVLGYDGELVYPLDFDYSTQPFSQMVQQLEDNAIGFSPVTLSGQGGRFVTAASAVGEGGWRVFVFQPEAIMLQPVLQLQTTFLGVGIALFVAIVLITYFLSRSLTTPLYAFAQQIQDLSAETTISSEISMPTFGLTEVDTVATAFSHNYHELVLSMQKIMELEKAEMHSRLLALQAQMNPHFLYNTLANISIMAEDRDADEIVSACQSLSDMLRYISADSPLGVPLQQELAHVHRYVYLMKIRYEDNLLFFDTIPRQLYSQVIPKLCIQPLIENCMKYALQGPTPWRIELSGRSCGDRWEITVRDHSQGFSPDFLDSFHQQVAQIQTGQAPPSLSPGGMGLLNICLRLSYFYPGNSVFEVGNCPDSGAYVTIGGPLTPVPPQTSCKGDSNDAMEDSCC